MKYKEQLREYKAARKKFNDVDWPLLLSKLQVLDEMRVSSMRDFNG